MPSSSISTSEAKAPLPDLPDEMLKNLGLVIVKHSITEAILLKLVYRLAGVDDVTGRVAIREPRSVDLWEMALDLAGQRNVSIEQEIITTMRRDLPIAANRRDSLAHGLFFTGDEVGKILVRETAGTWQPKGMPKGKVKKRILPPAKPISAEMIFDLARLIYSLNEILLEVYRQVVSQLARDSKATG